MVVLRGCPRSRGMGVKELEDGEQAGGVRVAARAEAGERTMEAGRGEWTGEAGGFSEGVALHCC